MSQYAGHRGRGRPYGNQIMPTSQFSTSHSHYGGYDTYGNYDQDPDQGNYAHNTDPYYQQDNEQYQIGYGNDHSTDTDYNDYGYENVEGYEGYGQAQDYQERYSYEESYQQDNYPVASEQKYDYHNYSSGQTTHTNRGNASSARFPRRGTFGSAHHCNEPDKQRQFAFRGRGSSRGGFAVRGQFDSQSNQSQSRFGSRGSSNNFARGRGRGTYNQNQSINESESKESVSDDSEFQGGQFGTLLKKDQTKIESPLKETPLTSLEQSSNIQENKDAERNKGQFGIKTEDQCQSESEMQSKQKLQVEPSLKELNNKQLNQKKETNDKQSEGKKKEDEDGDSDSSDEDTDFCKYCKLNFSTPKAYHTHTRGLQHTTLVMEAKAKKGDSRYQKETVDAAVLEVHIPAPQPVEVPVAMDDIDLDTEENWMNLDDDVIKYIKDRRHPEKRDLNPDDLGKKALPDDFLCPLCNVRCTGAGAYKMHIEGKQHRTNVEAAKQGANSADPDKMAHMFQLVWTYTSHRGPKTSIYEGMARIKRKKLPGQGVMVPVEADDRTSKIYEIIKSNTSPMLGLEFVTEFQKTDKKASARYVCNLCEARCDGSTIVPHIVGLKHRLKFMQSKRPLMYEHLTKYNSKKKKSEMNANMEDFAIEIEKELGRGDVKIKVELEEFEDEDELKESMIRHSKALAEKVKELEEGKSDELPPMKKTKVALDYAPERREFYNEPKRPYDNPRRPYDDYARPYDDRRRLPYDDWRRPYNNPRRPYDDPWDTYSRRRYPEDFRASYRAQFDPYHLDDPMYERRMIDERRRLDGLMGERHQLDDPYAEQRRVDDIIERRKYLDQLEKNRLNDILERRKRLQESDVDYLRMQRFMDRERPTPSSSSNLSEEERKRLEDQLARREALKPQARPEDHLVRREALKPPETYERTQNDVQAIQSKLASHRSDDPVMAARQIQAAKDLHEEASKNPNVNIREIMSSLSSSMIATEDDAAMALQISNALTQALLKYRLQNASHELQSITHSMSSVLEQKPAEPSIPGLDTSTTSSSVPSFLRSSHSDSYSAEHSVSDGNAQLYTSVQNIISQVQKTFGGSYQQSSVYDNTSYTQQSSVKGGYFGQSAVNSSYSALSSIASSYSGPSAVASSYPGQSSVASSYPGQSSVASSYPRQSSVASSYPGQSSVASSYPGQNTVASSYLGQSSVASSYPGQSSVASSYPGQNSVASSYPGQNSVASSYPGQSHVASSYPGQSQSVQNSTPSVQSQSLQRTIQAGSYPAYLQSQQATPAQSPVSAPLQSPASQTQSSPINTSNVDQPQKLLLESIRKQTELLRQKIQGTSVMALPGSDKSPVNVQSQSKHEPGSLTAASGKPAASLVGHVTSSANQQAASGYSSQYYQRNYHSQPPNSAPAPVPPLQPPPPRESAPQPPLPTNDLPPLRIHRHR